MIGGWSLPTSCDCIDPGTLAVGTAELVWPPLKPPRSPPRQHRAVQAAPTDTLEHTLKEHNHGYQEGKLNKDCKESEKPSQTTSTSALRAVRMVTSSRTPNITKRGRHVHFVLVKGTETQFNM